MQFCSNCGSQLSAGSQFCESCGAFNAMQPQKTMKRNEFISNSESAAGWISRIILLICAALIILSLCMTLWGSLLDNPLLNAIVGITGMELRDFEDDLDDAVQEMDDYVDENNLSRKYKEVVEIIEDLSDNLSIMNLRAVLKAVADDEYEEIFEGMDEVDLQLLDAATGAVDTVIGIFVVLFGIGIVLSIFAAIYRNTVLTVFGMLSSVVLCSIMSSAFVGFILLALFIAGIVLNVQLSNKYREYVRRQSNPVTPPVYY